MVVEKGKLMVSWMKRNSFPRESLTYSQRLVAAHKVISWPDERQNGRPQWALIIISLPDQSHQYGV